MSVIGTGETSAQDEAARREVMRTPDEVAAMLELKRRGWGAKRIAREFGTCPKTVRRYLRQGGWMGYARGRRAVTLAGMEGWLEEHLVRHGGNADVVRQELASERRGCGQPAHCRAGLCAVPAATVGGSPRHDAVRDAAGTAAADRLRRTPCSDRRGVGREEAAALRSTDGRTPFHATRELIRRVQSDCAVEVETNGYSVPWRLIGERVLVTIAAGVVRIAHAGTLVATHQECPGHRERVIDPAHFAGVVGFREKVQADPVADLVAASTPAAPALLRPLAEYETAAGGAWRCRSIPIT